MDYLTFVYKGSSRDLRKIILALLNSWVADDVKRLNYCQDYSSYDKKVEKGEEKIVLIHTENQGKLLDFLSKSFSQLERISIN